MNYINRPKSAYTQEERIKYLEESIRELRIEKDRIRKEKGEYHHKILRLEEENKILKEALKGYIKRIDGRKAVKIVNGEIEIDLNI